MLKLNVKKLKAYGRYRIIAYFNGSTQSEDILYNDSVLLGNEMTRVFKETVTKMRYYSGVSEQEQHIRYSVYATGRVAEES